MLKQKNHNYVDVLFGHLADTDRVPHNLSNCWFYYKNTNHPPHPVHIVNKPLLCLWKIGLNPNERLHMFFILSLEVKICL